MSTEPLTANSTPNGEQSHRTKGLLRLTMACNERCPFCNVPVEDYPNPTPPIEELHADLAAFAESGEQTLVISGGEPTLLKRRLLSLIERARTLGLRFVELQSNAVLIDKDYARALADAGLTSAFVSLLSHERTHHDFLAGLDGAFERCLAGIDALLDAGIAVTLNPVIARRTQSLTSKYVDFIGLRFPRIRSISLSAVQPHGRAATALTLLPDYDVLAGSIRAARQRARVHGIKLLNPYCGLPLCIGWDDNLEVSVEAIEAQAAAASPPGIDNSGNKSQQKPCTPCALRTRCGGAWHAYWEHRDGAGIAAPLGLQHPANPAAAHTLGQSVIHAPNGLDDRAIAAMARADTPTVWLWTAHLEDGDAKRLCQTRCTDLAIDFNLSAPTESRAIIRELRRLQRIAQISAPQRQLRIHLGWTPDTDHLEQTTLDAGIALAEALGAASISVPEKLLNSNTLPVIRPDQTGPHVFSRG
jgi:organic radical activating enzyme